MLILLYTATIFLGAFLLFLVQPMAAKAILPALGGSPAVWNACMVFFQCVLLAGYGYAHALARVRRPRVWMGVHGVVVLLPLLLWWRAVPVDPGTPPTEGPVPWLLMLLATTVGPFFFLLATTGPLLQRWFAATDHPRAGDPYFLYAASNAGSLLALLAYPVVVEPALGLEAQARAFAAGYAVFAVLILACGVALIRRSPAVLHAAPAEAAAITGRQRLLWVGLAFAPSSLMLGVTQFFSTDLAAVPLLWVVPLAIYLLTFILAFATRQVLSLRLASLLLAALVLIVLGTIAAEAKRPLSLLVVAHLAVLFVGALVCHRRLALARPPASGLTQYYLLIALGGALGGVFNALVAPVIFTSITEYPIALVLVLLLRPPSGDATPVARTMRRSGILAATALVILPAALAGIGMQSMDLNSAPRWLELAWVIVPLGACAPVFLRPRLLAGAVALLLAVSALRPDAAGTLLFEERTFFGVVRVHLDRSGKWNVLTHGNTWHGVQHIDPEIRGEPTLYYHRSPPRGSPISDVFEARRYSPTFRRCAFVGLGAGTLAAYGRPGLEFTFYEIDPVVAAVAQSPDLFHYLADARARGTNIRPVVLGDARLSLRDAPDGAYDLIVLDAFSSDAIPVHLVTREAIELYLSKLSPDGLLAFHITNRYLDLRPVLGAAARDLRLAGVTRLDLGPALQRMPLGARVSMWAVLARADADLRSLSGMPDWTPLTAEPGRRAWTDHYSNVLGALGAPER